MNKLTRLTILYDYYGELFNEHQRSLFEDYYFQNLSLGEISENNKVSRSAVHKVIKLVEDKLEEYEKNLKLYQKSILLDKVIAKLDNDELKRELEELK